MGKITKIEDRTVRFIEEHARLKKDGVMTSNVELARLLDMPSKSTVSEILSQRQNIQPKQWSKFKSHFGIKDQNSSEKPVPRETQLMEILVHLMGTQNQILLNQKENIIEKVKKIETNLYDASGKLSTIEAKTTENQVLLLALCGVEQSEDAVQQAVNNVKFVQPYLRKGNRPREGS